MQQSTPRFFSFVRPFAYRFGQPQGGRAVAGSCRDGGLVEGAAALDVLVDLFEDSDCDDLEQRPRR